MEILIYLLKSTLILSLFILVFELFLKNETLYRANRIFLLSGIFLALILPYMNVENIVFINEYIEPISTEEIAGNNVLIESQNTEPQSFWQNINFLNLVFFLYIAVAFFFLSQFVFRLVQLTIFLKKEKTIKRKNGIRYIETHENTGPFSFFNTIVYNPKLHTNSELKLILKHEEAHVKNRHSIDVILSNLLLFINWFNPFCWLYRKRITENLEFLADRETTQKLDCSIDYQRSLLNFVKIEHRTFPVNNFHKSFIARRIQKLQQLESKKYAGLRFALILPLLTIFFFVFQVDSRAEINYIEVPTEELIKNGNIKDSVSVVAKSLKVGFVKTSEEKSFEKVRKLLKSQEIDFDYSDLKYDDNGFLTAINMSFTDKNKEKYDYSIFGDKPIPNIELVISDSFTGFKTYPDMDETFSIDRKSAIINNGHPSSSIEKHLKNIIGENDETITEENINLHIKTVEVFKNKADEPFIFINGENQKDSSASKKKVLISKNIYTENEVDKVLFTIDKNAVDVEIQNLEKFFDSTSVEFSAESIERNEKGEITKITFESNKDKEKTYTISFENQDGISPFKVGTKNGKFHIE